MSLAEHSQHLGLQTPPHGEAVVPTSPEQDDSASLPTSENTDPQIPSADGITNDRGPASDDSNPVSAREAVRLATADTPTPVVRLEAPQSLMDRLRKHPIALAGSSAVAAAGLTVAGLAITHSSSAHETPTPSISASPNPATQPASPTVSSSVEASPSTSPTNTPTPELTGFTPQYEGVGVIIPGEVAPNTATFEWTPSFGDGTALTLSEIPDPAKYPEQTASAIFSVIGAVLSEPDDKKAKELAMHIVSEGPVLEGIMRDRQHAREWVDAQGYSNSRDNDDRRAIGYTFSYFDTTDHPADVTFNPDTHMLEVAANNSGDSQLMARLAILFQGQRINPASPYFGATPVGANLHPIDTAEFRVVKRADGKGYEITRRAINQN